MSDHALERLAAAVCRTRVLTRGRVATGRSREDADESIGTIATDGALGLRPFPLFEGPGQR